MDIDLKNLSAESIAELKANIQQEEKRKEDEHVESLFQRVADLPVSDMEKLYKRMQLHLDQKHEEYRMRLFGNTPRLFDHLNKRQR